MKKLSLSLLHYIGILEGASFLVLLGIAMPLKYAWDMPSAVRMVGMAHGVLFVLYLLAIAVVAVIFRWKIGRVLLAVVSAFLPAAPFILDRRIRKELTSV